MFNGYTFVGGTAHTLAGLRSGGRPPPSELRPMVDLADFVVTAPDDRAQLVVEVKRRPGAGPEWAAALRRNLFAHAALPAAPYFLLALPDRFYLWKDAPPAEAVAPQYAFDARAELAPYADALHSRLDDLSEEGFALLVQAWLSDLLATLPPAPAQVGADTHTGVPAERRRWLWQSGLAEALRRGQLRAPGIPVG